MADKDDPLQLKLLAVNYEYLMYKINDHIGNLSEKTNVAVEEKRRLIEDDYFVKQLDIDTQLKHADDLLAECNEVEQQLMKLDQLYGFADDFKQRISDLEEQFGRKEAA